MTGILAIETATEACSVALFRDGHYMQRHAVAPRRHSHIVFAMLQELLPSGDLRRHGINAIAYGCGPGSFTGLRIAASAVQGLAYASGLPALAVSTLAGQAQTALRSGLVDGGATVLSVLDARIDEIYSAVYTFEEGLATLRSGPAVCAPGQLELPADCASLCAVGSGYQLLAELPPGVRTRVTTAAAQVLPEARDLIPLALAQWRRGEQQSPQQVQPVYVRNDVRWKKLAEQGKRS
ncbi:MAG: tRNA (adenosine(37)-N6)-threonylcarbamoyltransferase complex dimerization subunit type 1 TsaB [Halioglobus sp.]|nr:tRNA (adenosine(37)-N6)-threonylcarbamoyltransferase complex dimerization subunit type 1 TsaB [Halioglobus sp.]